MDWLLQNRYSVAGSLVVVLALCASLVVWATETDVDESVTAAADRSSTTTSTTSTTTTTTTTEPTSSESISAAPTSTTVRPGSTTAPSATDPPAPTEPPPTTAPPTTLPGPAYRSSIESVTAEELGASWTPGRGCTPPDQLRKVTVTYWGYDDRARTGQLIVAAGQARNVAAIFGDIYAARFPIQRMVPVSEYGADDQASMRANNTSGFNCRTVAGSSTLSNHARGQAIDINPLHNPYVKGSTVDPPEGAEWADRSRNDPGMIRSGDAVVRSFAARGWGWGGTWSSPDYQHFDR
ncbi:MAG: M15 family metallopeptidase [Acidimicrobiales bacterium]|nr:M15 family metallopeptidase [Acidimicrobiales bacterium]